MKTTLIFGSAIGALMLAVAAPSFAAPTPPAPPSPPPGGQAYGPGARGPDGRGFRQFRQFRNVQRATPEERAKRRADQFARMDANRDGRVTEPEFHNYIEARKREREHRAFLRFSGDQESVTLDQLNARALQREQQMRERLQNRRGGGDRGARPQGGFDGRDFDRPAAPPPPARPNL